MRRLLIYTPNHPFIAAALKGIAEDVIRSSEEHEWKDVTVLTGPKNFNGLGVDPVFRRNGCSTVNKTAIADGLHFVQQSSLCPETQQPEPIGIVQVTHLDDLSGKNEGLWRLLTDVQA